MVGVVNSLLKEVLIMRKEDDNRKSVRIHNEKVNKWIETLPYGKFTILINEFLEEQYKKITK